MTKCEVCGLPPALVGVGWGGITVQRLRPLHAAVIVGRVDAQPDESVQIERAVVCSNECAKAQQQRWQNDDLAEEILRYEYGKSDPSAQRRVSSIIRGHRARWEDS